MGSVDQLQPTLAVVPGTEEFRVTPTYVGQMLPDHQVIMTYGDSKKIARAIFPELDFYVEMEMAAKNVMSSVIENENAIFLAEKRELKSNKYRRTRKAGSLFG